MKRIAVIFFAVVVLFNALGFYGLLVGLQYQAGLDLADRLDRDQYSADATVTLRVPMALPYHIDNGTYKRVDGQILHHGEVYRLVKQKLESDTLYIVCIKDIESNIINQALSDYVKTFTDKPASSKQTTKFAAGFIKDFLPTFITLSSSSSGWNYSIFDNAQQDFFSSVSLSVFSPPPRLT